MTSPLSGIPVGTRRRMAATLALFAALLVAIGSVAASGASSLAVKVFVAIAFAGAVVLALMAWGVLTSVRQDVGESRLDAAVEAALAAAPPAVREQFSCGCGQVHDPDELHIVDAEPASCAHDGTGVECAHSCDTCALAALRPAPAVPQADRRS